MLKMQRNPNLNIVALSVVTIVFLVAGLAMAQGHGQGMGGKHGKFGMSGHGAGQGMGWEEDGGFGRFDRMAVRLDLSDDQKASIEKLHDDNRASNMELRKEMMRLRNELQGEMMKDEPSEKTVLGISAKMNDTKGELQANRLKTRLAVRKQLTPEQRDMMMLMGGQGQGQGRGQGNGRGQNGGFQGQKGCKGNVGPDCNQGNGFRGNRR